MGKDDDIFLNHVVNFCQGLGAFSTNGGGLEAFLCIAMKPVKASFKQMLKNFGLSAFTRNFCHTYSFKL